jgi:methylated-DNA-protein-cysteine methyltransferase-like protein
MDPFDRSSWTDFELAVGEVLDGLGTGDLLTYGEVAAEAGYPGAARAVGSMLARSNGTLPWWRVVATSGKLLASHEAEQALLLAGEGVTTRDGRVVRNG